MWKAWREFTQGGDEGSRICREGITAPVQGNRRADNRGARACRRAWRDRSSLSALRG